MENALERHDQILRSVLEGYGGYVFSTAGDAFAAAFSRVGDAVDAAMEAQSQLGSEPWPPLAPIRVRMGLHTGEAQERGGDYFGAAVNRAARIMSAGHGGQILASSVSAPMVEDVNFVDSGEHRLKDLAVPEHLFQVGVGQFPALRTLDQVPHNLPRLRTELVGREQQLSELSERISTNRLVTVAGVGGMGKTTIAVAAAARVADKFPDGVWFVDLAPVSGEGRVASAVAQAAGLRLDGAGDSAVRLGELIGDRRLLVVMDNCEHLIDEVAEVVDTILELSSDAHVLATSRERLDLDGEQLVVLDPLEAHGPDAAAVQLLQERASSIGVDLAGADPELLRRLCDGLDGMPLALELAAANLTHLSLEEMIEQLSSRFDLLETSGRGRRRGRQSSLLHVLSSSWDLLDPASQQMLTRLAVFPARFDAAAAIAVSADLANPSRSLRRLVDSSLIDVASTTGSGLRLLESVKQFALEHWEGDTALHRDHHLMWVHDHLVEASLEQRLLAGSQMADFFNHVEDFRAAINHATETAELDLAADLVMAGGYCSRMRSGAAAVELLSQIDVLLGLRDLSAVATAQLHLAAALASLGTRDLDRMDRESRLAVEHATAAAAPEVLVMAQIVSSWKVGTGDPERGIELLRAAQETALSAGLERLADAALTNTSSFLCLLGRDDEAAAVATEVLDRAVFDDYPQFHAAAGLATAITLSSPEEARDAYDSSQEMWRRVGLTGYWFDAALRAITSASLADPTATMADIREARARARRTGTDTGLPDLLMAPAVLAYRLDEPERCRSLLAAIRADRRPTGGYPLTIMYRQLQRELGNVTPEANPQSSEDAFREALGWIEDLIHD